MRSLRATISITIALLLSSAFAGGAAQARVTGIVAPLTPLGITPKEAAKVRRWVSAAVTGVPGHRWLTRSRLDRLLSQPRYRECGSQPTCLGGLAKKLGARVVISGEVGSLSGAYMTYLRLVNDDGELVRSISGVLDPRKPGLRDATQELVVRLLVPRRHVGSITVKVDVPNAWIYLNGQRIARSPTAPISVPVGTHALRVTHESYRDFVRFVEVGFNDNVKVSAGLRAYPVKAGTVQMTETDPNRPLTHDELPWYRRWWAVAAFGAVILAATTTTVAILAQGSVSRDSEVVIRP
jgi:hypothetical protein